ncbi:MAG: hypothetical protein IPG50_19015 [Myxococcales bacterium]|nr:hypothetical protein [Myxococcales bacterium]
MNSMIRRFQSLFVRPETASKPAPAARVWPPPPQGEREITLRSMAESGVRERRPLPLPIDATLRSASYDDGGLRAGAQERMAPHSPLDDARTDEIEAAPPTMKSERPKMLRPIVAEEPEAETLDRDTADGACALPPVRMEPNGPWEADEPAVRGVDSAAATPASSRPALPRRRASTPSQRSQPFCVLQLSCPASSGALWPDDEEEAALSPLRPASAPLSEDSMTLTGELVAAAGMAGQNGGKANRL